MTSARGAVAEVLIAKPTHLHRKNDQARMEMNWECDSNCMLIGLLR